MRWTVATHDGGVFPFVLIVVVIVLVFVLHHRLTQALAEWLRLVVGVITYTAFLTSLSTIRVIIVIIFVSLVGCTP